MKPMYIYNLGFTDLVKAKSNFEGFTTREQLNKFYERHPHLQNVIVDSTVIFGIGY